MSTRADIMHVMAQEVGREDVFGHRKGGGQIRNFWRMAGYRNGAGLRRGNRKPPKVRVWRAKE